MGPINAEEEIAHANYKKDMADLMRDEAFGPSVCLHGPGRVDKGK